MKTKTKNKKKSNLKLIMYCIIALIFASGLITILNISIFAGLKVKAFMDDPIGVQPTEILINVKKQEKEIKNWKVIEEYTARVTAYNAGDPNQCDNSPCIAANGENVCTAVALGFGRCASNRHKFGTILMIDDNFICTVTDRMNPRYVNGEVDIAMPADQKKEAIAYGGHDHNIKVVE